MWASLFPQCEQLPSISSCQRLSIETRKNCPACVYSTHSIIVAHTLTDLSRALPEHQGATTQPPALFLFCLLFSRPMYTMTCSSKKHFQPSGRLLFVTWKLMTSPTTPICRRPLGASCRTTAQKPFCRKSSKCLQHHGSPSSRPARQSSPISDGSSTRIYITPKTITPSVYIASQQSSSASCSTEHLSSTATPGRKRVDRNSKGGEVQNQGLCLPLRTRRT